MDDYLFVYGSLAPGRPNEHVLAPLDGTWKPATVRGHLRQQGWGAWLGFPGIVLDEEGEEVEGFLFTAESLAEFWPTLDEFEGSGYQRTRVRAQTRDGTTVEAFVYTLRSN